MSRSLPSPPLSSVSLAGLQAMANDLDPITDHTARQWFEIARYEAEKAILAERRNKKEEMFVQYVRTCQAYSNCKMHPGYSEEKKKDSSLGHRVKDFKEVCRTSCCSAERYRPTKRSWAKRKRSRSRSRLERSKVKTLTRPMGRWPLLELAN